MSDIWRRSDGLFTVRAWAERHRGGHRYRVRYWFRGCPPRTQSADGPEAAAARAEGVWAFYASGELEAPERTPSTLGEALELWTTRDDLADATVRTYTAAMVLYLEHADDRPLVELTRRSVERWLEGFKPTTYNSYLRTARAFFRWCVERRYIAADPTKGIKYAKTEKRVRPWLRRDEWAAFLAHCQPTLAIRAEFVLHTGLRASELAAAQWEWVHGDLGAQAISVPASKSAKARAVPLNNRAVDVLEVAREEWGSTGPIFSTRPIKQLNNWPRRCRQASARAGVTSVDFHGLRRSAGAHWLSAAIPMHIVSLWLGHRDIGTTMRHYAGIADRESLRWVLNEDEAPNVVPMRRVSDE